MENAGVCLIDDVEEIDGAGLRDGEDGRVVGEIALDVPVAGGAGVRLGGGAEVDVGGADPDVGGAVELNSFGDGEVGFENHFCPGARTSGGRRVRKILGSEVVELELAVERDFAGCRLRAGHGRVGEGGVAGADSEFGGNAGREYDGREKDEERG